MREGLVGRGESKTFNYDRTLGTTVEELGKSVQFTTNVVIQRNRIPRTRAKFDEWGVTFVVEADDELVDASQLEQWLARSRGAASGSGIGGRRSPEILAGLRW